MAELQDSRGGAGDIGSRPAARGPGGRRCLAQALARRLDGLGERGLRLAVIGFAAFLISMLWFGTAWRLIDKHEQIEADVADDLQNISHAIAQRLYSDFLVTDVMLGILRAEIERHPDRDPTTDPAIGSLIDVFKTRTSSVTDLLIVGKDNRLRSLDAPGSSEPVLVEDREYVRVPLETGQESPYVAAPVVSRLDHTRRWTISLRLRGPQPWMGLLVTGLTTDRILAPLAAARPKPNGVIALYRLDGTLMAASPDPGPMLGQRSEAMRGRLAQLVAAGPGGLIRLEHWDAADQETYVAYDQLKGYPLVLVTTLKVSEVHAVLVAEIWQSGLILLVITALTCGGAWWLARLMRQLREANAGLEDQVRARIRDLTAEVEQRRQTEVRLQKFMQAVESSDSGVVISHPDLSIEYINPAFARMIGYAPDALIGQGRDLWRSPNREPEVDRKVREVIFGRQTWRGELLHRRRDGSDFWVMATVSPVIAADGTITHFVAVEEDITERRHHEAELREAMAAAERANLAKSEFLSAMSHELRTPMNSILGFAQLLRDSTREALTDRQKMFVDRILRGGEHLLALINEVLDLARVEAGRLQLSLEPVDLRSVLAECLTLIENLAEKHEVTMVDQTVHQLVPTVQGDYTRLKQAVINLLSNAVKYNRSGGTVILSVTVTTPGRVRLVIADTGRGIPAARQGELFQPFNRLGLESSAIEGTGIGLTVTRKLIEAMKGTIGFASREGAGSTFWIELPLAQRTGAETPVRTAAAFLRHAATREGTPARERSLLYIEDNPANLTLMDRIVEEKTAFAFLSAHTAELGLEIIRSKRPAVVVIDINLPGMNGMELARHLTERADTRDIPLIALSADAMPATIERGLAAGFRRYLIKPIDINVFLAALGDVLPDRGP
ncbi:MAG: ATP-binding protein [Rhodospirillaceae bacterium]